VRVKICGITNIDDALAAVYAGADALGFVFYEKSPRYVSAKKAKEIVSKLPPFVTCTGLFVNVSSSFVNEVCLESGMDLAQIHFEADKDFYDSLRVKHIKVVRARSKEDLHKYEDEYRIVDAFVESYGGEGKRVEISWFENVDRSKIILAGGLTPKNLKEVKNLGFYGVDVSSGVEREKGIKDHKKINEFVKIAKSELNEQIRSFN